MKTNNQKGITLIALVITIIVIVVMVGITINAVIGDDGIISEAKQAKDDYYSAENSEQQTLDSAVSAIRRAREEAGMISSGQNGNSGINTNSELENTESGNENNNTIANEINGGSVSQDDPVVPVTDNTGTIGTAVNSNKYGWKVVGYEAAGLVWRLFYEDANNVYLISETQDGDFPISGIRLYDQDANFDDIPLYSSYQTGASISAQGQALMPLAGGAATSVVGTNSSGVNYFVESERGPWAWSTAYLCDITKWETYKTGNAAWAMGGPTIELFAASYNATHANHQIVVTFNQYGYDDGSSVVFSKFDNHGIYTLKGEDAFWWISYPYFDIGSQGSCMGISESDSEGCIARGDGYEEAEMGSNGPDDLLYYYSVRPIVCFQKANFNYTLVDE